MTAQPLVAIAGAAVALCLAACQPTAYLISKSSALENASRDVSRVAHQTARPGLLTLFYATNRQPLGTPGARQYADLPGSDLRLGVATLRIADEEPSARELRALPPSGAQDRSALRLESLEERAALDPAADVASTPAAVAFFAEIDRALSASADKDVFVYVHGTYNNVYRSLAQAAQYPYLTGRGSVVVAFVWPSVDNYFDYSTDARSARRSVPQFARLIELLAKHTAAEHINILAHSAGARVVSAALASLGSATTGVGRESLRLRLGEVYYAAADIGVEAFVRDLRHSVDLPLRTTLQVNRNDFMLALASIGNGRSRAGRPNLNELDPEQRSWLGEWTTASRLDLIDLTSEHGGELSGSGHAFWYERPWVSCDVLLEFTYHASPEARGLKQRVDATGPSRWTFPHDYEQRIGGAVAGGLLAR